MSLVLCQDLDLDDFAEWWPHPCYLGGSYLGCGWAWIYECQQWGEAPTEECEPGMGPETHSRRVLRAWPHLCEPCLLFPPGRDGFPCWVA